MPLAVKVIHSLLLLSACPWTRVKPEQSQHVTKSRGSSICHTHSCHKCTLTSQRVWDQDVRIGLTSSVIADQTLLRDAASEVGHEWTVWVPSREDVERCVFAEASVRVLNDASDNNTALGHFMQNMVCFILTLMPLWCSLVLFFLYVYIAFLQRYGSVLWPSYNQPMAHYNQTFTVTRQHLARTLSDGLFCSAREWLLSSPSSFI